MNYVHRLRDSISNQETYFREDFDDHNQSREADPYNPYLNSQHNYELQEYQNNNDFDDSASGVTSLTEVEKYKIFQTVLDMVCEASLDPG